MQEGGADPSKQVADPYANEPKRHRALKVQSAKPFNAETPSDALASGSTTPNELFYVRNHLPVPHVEPSAYSVRPNIGTCGSQPYISHACYNQRTLAGNLRETVCLH